MSIIQLLNNQQELILKPEDLVYVAEKYLGYEYSSEIESIINTSSEEEIYARERINTDLEAYESELESNTYCFIDIQNEIESFQKYLSECKRLDRSKLDKFINNISILVDNQI